jgi:hypothetical protein
MSSLRFQGVDAVAERAAQDLVDEGAGLSQARVDDLEPDLPIRA